ncbi:MAG: serine/threonine-protein kinase [Bradymonadia bacterium]
MNARRSDGKNQPRRRRATRKPDTDPGPLSSSAQQSDVAARVLAAQIPKRLRLLVLVMMTLQAVGLVIEVMGMMMFDFAASCSGPNILTNALLLGFSGALLYKLKHRDYSADTLVKKGLIYQVAICFGVALSEQAVHAHGQWKVAGISMVCIILLVFPLFLPTSPRKTAIASFAGAAMPVIAGLIYTFSTQQSTVETSFSWYYAMNFVVAGMAVLPATIMQQIGRDMDAAKRLGSYQLEEKLGAGGMGEVWRASHQLLRRPAAIKLIRPEALGAGDENTANTLLRRFEREAQATANLHSPHSIMLYDFGITEQGSFYYVMEYLQGFSLEDLVERFGPVPPERAVHLLMQACHALSDAHQSGLIHRDIKPANIFVCRYGHTLDFVKVLDFGLVKSFDSTAMGSSDQPFDPASLTGADVTAGTPAYMAPEMALAPETVDPRADIYALGCVAFWLLTGRHVFHGPTPLKVLMDHINTPAPSPAELMELHLPKSLEDLVLRCLSKEAKDRPQSADELCDALEAIQRELEAEVVSECGERGWGRGRQRMWWLKHAPGNLGNLPMPKGKRGEHCTDLAVCRKQLEMLETMDS